MAKPADLVELGFDLTENNTGPYFRLDNETAGRLNNTDWVLGGTIFFDVTSRVKSYSIKRGKSRQLDRYATGQASIVFDNNDRAFDPTFEASPYYGQIIPRRDIRITSGSVIQYFGSVDDWNLNFEPNGNNNAEAVCSDALRTLANQTLSDFTNVSQLSGARVTAVLEREEIKWSRPTEIDPGRQTLGADVVASNTNALAYLQLVEASEPGALFMSKAGSLVFRDRDVSPISDSPVLADDGTGINYQGMKVVYGSELLYNTIDITSKITGETASAINALSQGIYGELTLSQTGLLMEETADAQELADYYSAIYSSPEFRFESVNVALNELSTANQNKVLDFELGTVVKIIFTPGNPATAPAIEKFAEIIRLDHTADSTFHFVSIGFATLDGSVFVLDDAVFGRIGTGVLGF